MNRGGMVHEDVYSGRNKIKTQCGLGFIFLKRSNLGSMAQALPGLDLGANMVQLFFRKRGGGIPSSHQLSSA
eukprot:4842874-Amphidinium_carterae.1